MKILRDRSSLETQLHLHLMSAVHDAVSRDSLVPRKALTPPNFVPAGLGSTQPIGGTSSHMRGLDTVYVAQAGAALVRGADLRLHEQRLEGLQRSSRRIPGYVDLYQVSVPSITLSTPSVQVRVPAQTLHLDCRTPELSAAVGLVIEAARPVYQKRGVYARQTNAYAEVRAAWVALAAAAVSATRVQVTAREDGLECEAV